MLPAQAGVILQEFCQWVKDNDAPRAGGGDPMYFLLIMQDAICSPRRRG